MRAFLLVWLPLMGCDPSITDPCPGQRTCPNSLCCDEQYPYNCGASCYAQPCGTTQVTCIHVDRTDGCYGGKWSGTFNGGTVAFDILDHVITATSPATGTGTIDCDTGTGSWTTGGQNAYTFRGTWRHTDDQGDRISGATWTSGTTGNGTWDALRIE